MKKILICILIILVIISGCTQTSSVAGVYVNEANTGQRILLNERGTFSLNQYDYTNHTDNVVKNGNYTVKKSLITLTYPDDEIVEFSIDGNEMIQISGNASESPENNPVKRYAKVILQK